MDLSESDHDQTGLAHEESLEEVSLYFSDSSVQSELVDGFSDLSGSASCQQTVEDLQYALFLVVAHSFTKFFDTVNVSPSLETVTHVSSKVLEELDQSFFLQS